MRDRIDIGEDKNLVDPDAIAAIKKKVTSLLLDDLPKNPDDAVYDAKRAVSQYWLNSEPLLAGYADDEGSTFLFFLNEDLKKKVVLIYFCDFSLPPCRRVLDYVSQWNKRYSSAGLVTILVHSPLFEFGRLRFNVETDAQSNKVDFPLVMDNDFAIWKAFENRYWPRRILLTSKGEIFHDTIGETEYQDFELSIQHLLRKLSPGLSCPPLLDPIHESDKPGYEEPQTTPDLFFGSKRGRQLANDGEETPNSQNSNELLFAKPDGPLIMDLPYLEGFWQLGPECVAGFQYQYNKALPYKGEMKVTVSFTGTDVYVLAGNRPKVVGDMPQVAKVSILVNKKALTEDYFGNDTTLNDSRRGSMNIKQPKLFHIVSKLDYKTYELSLSLDADSTDTFEIYGIFFSSKKR